MTVCRELSVSKRVMGRLDPGVDLLEALTEICADQGITVGRVEAIGAVHKARLAFYNQATHEYEFRDCLRPMEIASLTGNVSIRDGKAMVHAHVCLADHESRTMGGHLAPGTIVFACEYLIECFEGAEFVRGEDDFTGLPLWEE